MTTPWHRAIACLVLASAMAVALPSATPNPKTKGFAVTRLVLAMYEGKTGETKDWNTSDGLPECPEGFNVGPDNEAVLAKLPPAERARLQRPENAGELSLRMRNRGGLDVCMYAD